MALTVNMNKLNFMLKFFILSFLVFFTNTLLAADSLVLYSPDKKIQVVLNHKTRLFYLVNYNGEKIIDTSCINLQLINKQDVVENLKVKTTKFQFVDETIISPARFVTTACGNSPLVMVSCNGYGANSPFNPLPPFGAKNIPG